MNAIFAERLTKSFNGRQNAVDLLTLDIPEGIAYGLVGGSGAGKTTVVKMMAGLLTPDSGQCTIMGINPVKAPAHLHQICGVVTSTAHMYACMTGRENLILFGQMAGMKTEDAQIRAAELMKDLGIWQARDLLVRDLPTGMLQRISLARALMTHPRVLLLDEPTSGLDTEGAEAVLSVISGLVREEGVTVLLCTHHLIYAQQLCGQFGILKEGHLIANGSLETLCQEASCHIRAGFRLPQDDKIQGFTKCSDGFWEREIDSEEEMPDLMRKMVAEGHDIYEARLNYPTLTEAYTTLIGKEELL